MASRYLYGLHAVKKKLQMASADCVRLYCVHNRNQRLAQVTSLARQLHVSVEQVEKARLTELAGSDKHQGCVLEVTSSPIASSSLEELLQDQQQDDLFLVLDGVQDPHNLGACLRSADAAGVRAVIVPKDRAAGITPVVSKVAAGGAESVPLITVTNLVRSLKDMQAAGIWVIGTSGDAEQTIYDLECSGPIALVMGAEGEGMRRLTAEQCDYRVKLPMLGQVESLNVSVATGICLFEINRQRGSN